MAKGRLGERGHGPNNPEASGIFGDLLLVGSTNWWMKE
jgi:hypothetical protein